MSFKFTRVDLVLLLMVLVWGGNITVIKTALNHFDASVFNCLRFVIASLVMMVLYRDVFKDRLSKKDLLHLIVLGILGNTVYQFFFIHGVKYTHVTHASILLAVSPLFTAAISSQMGFERVGRQIWFGIALSFSGIAFIVFGGKALDIEALSTNLGDLFILLACLSWSIYTTFSKRIVSEYSHRHYLAYTVLFGTAFMIPVSLRSFWIQDWSALGPMDLVALLYSALGALVFGYSAWYYGVGKIGSTRTSVYANLTPVAGLVIGMIFLGERFSWQQWIGALFIFTGLVINRLAKHEPVGVGEHHVVEESEVSLTK
jgi:drug/metabolite transporter (DMT)-like permease